jgi:hypothetical protein
MGTPRSPQAAQRALLALAQLAPVLVARRRGGGGGSTGRCRRCGSSGGGSAGSSSCCRLPRLLLGPKTVAQCVFCELGVSVGRAAGEGGGGLLTGRKS